MTQSLQRLIKRLTANPSLAIVIIEGFVSRLGFGVITFALPFFALSMGMSFTEIGILAALRLVTAIAFKPMMGWAADRFGKKPLFVCSIAGRVLVGILFALASEPWMLYAIRLFHGFTTAARDPASAILIAEHGAAGKMASAFAWYGTAREVGAALGFFIAGMLLTVTQDNYPVVFLFSVAASTLSLILAVIYVKEHRAPAAHNPGTDQSPDAAAPLAWLYYALFGVMAAITGSMVTHLFPIIATEVGHLSKAQTGLIFMISTLVIIIAGPFFGWLSDHVSRSLVLSLRAVANALSSILYLLTANFTGITAARLFDDAGKAAFRPAWGALMAQLAETKRQSRGKSIAYLDTAQSVGEAAGPLLAGLLWDHWGIIWLFAVRLLLSLITEIYAIWLFYLRHANNSTT